MLRSIRWNTDIRSLVPQQERGPATRLMEERREPKPSDLEEFHQMERYRWTDDSGSLGLQGKLCTRLVGLGSFLGVFSVKKKRRWSKKPKEPGAL